MIVRGAVQGVGFRPFAWRLARACDLRGRIRNGAGGVVLDLEGDREALERFRRRLVREAPAEATVEGIEIQDAVPHGHHGLEIEGSDAAGVAGVRVPPDRRACTACLADVLEPGNRRERHPFASCSACGPRYSIVRAMPYDRVRSTMESFALCPDCEREYRTPSDRRFHAEPIACNACGPRAVLLDRHGEPVAGGEEAIGGAAARLLAGEIVALRGVGGFQLLVRADDAQAVGRLRARKRRPAKPLAVMVASMAEAERLGRLDGKAREALAAAAGPIVVVERRSPWPLAPGIAPGLRTVGLFLPTTPLHFLLLRRVARPLVVTSGNRSSEPLAIEVRDAVTRLDGIADAFLVHDRPIARRLDDSVVRILAGCPTTLRLGRGLAPLPLPALEAAARGRPPALAVGGHLKVAPALWNGAQAVLAQHVGDMEDPDTRHLFALVATDLADLYRARVERIACDMHPEYWTARWAADRWLPVLPVQHHHAHAAAVMAAHGLLDGGEVLAFTWDGTGWGPDGTVWGGEALRVQGARWRRVASLRPFPLPGGEAAIRHPERIAYGIAGDAAPLLGLPRHEERLLATMIARRLHTPATSSVGRLFDAMAALVLGVRGTTYDGEAAARLEAAADPTDGTAYPLPDGDWRALVAAVAAALRRGHDPARIAAGIHGGLARWAASVVRREGVSRVVLSGGCFQNALLAERVAEAVVAEGARVYLPGMVPPNDGGLAVGQLAVSLLSEP